MRDSRIKPEHFEKAELNGINRIALKQRVYILKWDVEKACSKRLRKKTKVPKEVLDIAKEHGLSRLNVVERIRRGWDIMDACTKPIKPGYPRMHPDWIYDKAKEHGLLSGTVNARILRGWSLEDACTLPTNDRHNPIKRRKALSE